MALSQPALARLLREGLATHRAHVASGAAPAERPTRTLDDIPAWRRKLDERARAGQRPLECYHCHFVYDAELHQARAEGAWRPDMIWRWPSAAQVGLLLDPAEQERVLDVREGSPAAAAGLQPGDRLLELGGQRVLSWSDASWALERARRSRDRSLSIAFARDGARRETALELAPGWERGDALTLSWRPSKWQLVPNPGFGGQALSADEKRALGLSPDAFALRVGYLITWGAESRFGRAAQQAGVRKGDVVLGVDDERAFASHDHFQAWWRLCMRVGHVARLELLRDGQRRTVELKVIE